MRIALLADIHANREALTACLDHAEEQRIDRWTILGDLVGYGADPAWTVDWARRMVEQGAAAVLGNHDQAAVDGNTEHMNANAAAAVTWTRAQLSAEQTRFLAELPLTVEDEDRLYVHANAWAPGRWGYVHGALDAERSLRATDKRLTFCGHVHPPLLFGAGPDGAALRFVPKPEIAIPLQAHRRWLAAVSSVGQPRDRNPAAGYAVYDSQRHNLVFHRIPYNVESAARKIRAAGLPEFLAKRLASGV